ncbi:MAG TPA: pyruvate dehydrogenase complex E1 component subunit beta [Jatrophihabitantaceae bacterium]|nr:pyruvate dehydrogenase complex E1 component subunit beta [Jatrophihabitantaceae bacterium]
MQLPTADRLTRYRQMRRIREFEARTATLYRDGIVPGFVHLSVGQEAVAVGVCSQLRTTDVITSTHRGHGHVLAKGLDMTAMFAELMGRATGTCGGFGGSMHIADPTLGVFGANGIVGAGLPIAGGAAFAARLRRSDQVVAAFFGDGAVATGAFHEAVNLAALWMLPVLLVCENNGFSEFSRTSDQHPVPLRERARGYGVGHVLVDGNDVDAVAAATARLVADLRAGRGPVLLEAVTERVRGHYEGDQQRYRDADAEPAPDPLERSRRVLLANGHTQDYLATIDREVDVEVDRAVAEAMAAPWPDVERMYELGDVRRVIARTRPWPAPTGDPTELRGSQATRAALDDAMADDDRVFIAGIDVAAGGGVFGITKGLAAKYPGRVLDTPISETAIMGLGVGAAMAGLRPVVELMYLDFVGVCLDQLMNQAAKLGFMTGGATQVGLVVRTQFAVGRSSGSQHSQSLEAMLAHLPGLVVVAPATVADMYGLLRSAIDLAAPVVIIENRLLYERKDEAPPSGHRTPIGQAFVARPGEDITIVTVSRALHTALDAATQVEADGISCEVIDLRTIAPLDVDTVLASLRRTNRLLVVTEGVGDFGVGAEVAARAVDEGFWSLDAPVRRLHGPSTPVPYSPPLERAWLPSVERVVDEIRTLCRDR